jgi:hypothetical protein
MKAVSGAVAVVAAVAVLGTFSFADLASNPLWDSGSSGLAAELERLSPSAREAVEALATAREETIAAALSDVDRSMAAARERVATKDLVAGVGRWRSSRYDPEDKTWQVQLERDRNDGAIAGTISAVGSSLLGSGARVSGRIDAGAVSGVITDDDGRQLASFCGTVGKEGMTGTYTTIEGDSGEWSHGEAAW